MCSDFDSSMITDSGWHHVTGSSHPKLAFTGENVHHVLSRPIFNSIGLHLGAAAEASEVGLIARAESQGN